MDSEIIDRLSRLVVDNEKDLYCFFNDNSHFFSPYNGYFYLRYNEYKLLTSLFPNVFLDKKVLEIGAGFGFNAFLISLTATEILGIDIPVKYPSLVVGNETTSIEIANKINSILNFKNVRFQECWPVDITCCETGSMDLIFSEYVLEHIPNLEAALTEMYRVLKVGGQMLHVVPITQDATIQFMYSQIENAKKKKTLRKLLNNLVSPVIIPGCHSEFLSDFSDQIKLYSLENYIFKMQEIGFVIQDIKQTREHNRAILAMKL